MDTAVETKAPSVDKAKMGAFFGDLFAFNNSLKLYHWHVAGKGSYAEHIALDQALDSVKDILDRMVETSYSLYGDLDITIPETPRPDNITDYVKKFYSYIESQREMFKSSSFSESIVDDYQEAIQQLLYRLRRLQ